MNVFDKILICLFLLAIIVWQASHQAKLFKQNKTISHFWKGMWYAAAVALVTIPYLCLYNWWYLLKIPILGVLERAALFDFILSLVERQKDPLFYYGKGTTTSKIDEEENKLPEWLLKTLKVVYILALITDLIFIK